MEFLNKNKYNILIVALVLIFLGVSSSLVMTINGTISNPIENDYSLYNTLISDQANNIEVVDDVTLITGKNPNNYIWYSGKLWRAVSVNNNDNTTKLVTQDSVNTLTLDDDIDEFLNDTSNNGFLGNLNDYEKYIKKDSIWIKYNDARPLGEIKKTGSKTEATQAVGLLNTYEYQLSYDGTTKSIGNSYLNNNTNWITYSYDNENYVYINSNGKIASANKLLAKSIRPSINILSNVKVQKGDGTSDNPYCLDIDEEYENKPLNTRYSGEYVKFNDSLYRIINKEDNKTKLVAVDPLTKVKFSSDKSNFDIEDSSNIGYYLNNTWHEKLSKSDKKLLAEGKFYLAKADYNTKYSDLIDKETIDAKIGLLRYGELYATSEDVDYFLITPYNDEYNRVIYKDSLSGAIKSNNKLAIKIALYIREEAYIIDGDGTINNPFIITVD